MCVILLFFRVHPEVPLIVAANRDEHYARRSSGADWLLMSPRAVGGRDLQAGGTWMGVCENRFFAGLTNLRTLGPPEPARRSRGEIVMKALRTASVAAFESWIGAADSRDYNPYNLVFGDARELRIASVREGDALASVSRLEPGLHVITNAPLGTASPKVSRSADVAANLSTTPLPALLPALRRVLADHVLPPTRATPEPPPWLSTETARKLQSLCVHTPTYGTRSSTIAAIGSDGVVSYEFADGPPCIAPFVDLTAMVSDARPGP